MKIGMLWFDNDPKMDLAAKVARAATYYRLKYGKTPTVCFVHPSMIPEAQVEQSHELNNLPAGNQPSQVQLINQTELALGGKEPKKPVPVSRNSRKNNKIPPATKTFQASEVEVRANPSVRPHHFWIGVNGAAPVNSTTSTSNDRSAGISPDFTLSSASSKR